MLSHQTARKALVIDIGGTHIKCTRKVGGSDVRELERLETLWNEAHEHGDIGALERLWADDMEVAVPKMCRDIQHRPAEILAFRGSNHLKLPEISGVRIRS